jgi:hypothetical protein
MKELDSLKLKSKLKRLGIYYDDPNKMESGKHRYLFGVVLNNTESGESTQERIDLEAQMTLEKNGYKLISLPQITNGIITEFPIKTNLSHLVSVFLVYSKFGKYFQV